ncbi:MAG: hypothetical protein Greene07147_449 [Parcubacteria group bacterium Greene0714_7]|nr:MAG: hypothetical protein Greene07147_449 [Parcubacteria group bacterium Greene0714_7]
MLYILLGSDVVKAKARAMKLAEGSELVRFGEGGEPFANVLRYRSARGLFAPKTTLLLDRPLEDADGKMLLTEHAKDLVEGEALVVVIEIALSAPTLKLIPKSAVIENFDVKEKKEAPLLSAFALTDSFATGDRKNSWITYRRLIESGSEPQEIHGILMWQARAMVVASKTKTAEEAGLKPFVYSKAKKAGARLGEVGCEEISRSLVRMVHQSRMGGGSLGDLLEAFLLKK